MITPQDISIIIPVYNVEKYLSECLDSILVTNQFTGEVICINDGSTDGSKDILEEYLKRHNNIIVFHQENNGQSVARNYGIKHALGKYLLFIDSDDMIPPHTINTLCNNIKNEDVIFYDMQLRDVTGGKIIDTWKTNPAKDTLGKDYYEYKYNNITALCSGIYRRDFLSQHNITFTPNIYYEDEIFIFKALFFAQEVSTIQKSLYIYRLNETSTTASFTPKHIISLFQVIDTINDFMQEHHWITQRTKKTLWMLYITLFLRMISNEYCRHSKLTNKHWKNMMACCSDNIQDIRTTKLARYSIKKAYQYHEYLMPKIERKLINFLLGK